LTHHLPAFLKGWVQSNACT